MWSSVSHDQLLNIFHDFLKDYEAGGAGVPASWRRQLGPQCNPGNRGPPTETANLCRCLKKGRALGALPHHSLFNEAYCTPQIWSWLLSNTRLFPYRSNQPGGIVPFSSPGVVAALIFQNHKQHVTISHCGYVFVTLSAAPMILVFTDKSWAVQEGCSQTWREPAESRISKHLSPPVELTILPVPSSEF